MFLIDAEIKGNVIQLYFGDDKDYWGDDWNDRPYEHNAELVYNEYIKKEVTVTFPFEYNVYTAEGDWTYNGNSPFSKQDFKENKAPFIIITKDDEYFDNYSKLLGSNTDNVLKIYFNTDMTELSNNILKFGGLIIHTNERNT